jgi:site-specific DNA recombinase
MQEQQPQAEPFEGMPQPEQTEQHLRTLAIRVDESLHTQLRFIAQMSGSSVTEEIRKAIANRIATAQDDPELITRAEQVRDEIEREAAARAAAIARLPRQTRRHRRSRTTGRERSETQAQHQNRKPLGKEASMSSTTVNPTAIGASPSKTAITYLRVSTADQAKRGGREEGFSIPAQREANTRKAASLDAIIVEEFVDAGESGTSAAKRPELQRMLAYVREHQIDYCIVHKLDRQARSRADDVAIHFALKQAGVTLVSTSENIDETPSGMLMHGIMSSIAEFYSRNLANEVTKGLVQKASLGGTVSRAPLGYKNIHVSDELGRVNRTVEIDPGRAHLITWAFYRYAEGDPTLRSLLDELTDRGLTTRATPKWPSKPLTVMGLHRLLRNPYYKGEVHYRGVAYPGLHEPLVDPQTWQQVQDLLTAHNIAGTHQRTNQHYLRGSVYCGTCGSRLMLTTARNRWGTEYLYLVCSGRTRRVTDCQRQAMPVEVIEELIEDEYRTIALSPELRDNIEDLVLEDFDTLQAAAAGERKQMEQQRIELTAQRQKLLDAHYAGAIPLDLLKNEQGRIATQLPNPGTAQGSRRQLRTSAHRALRHARPDQGLSQRLPRSQRQH